jgi:hypothetical protein
MCAYVCVCVCVCVGTFHVAVDSHRLETTTARYGNHAVRYVWVFSISRALGVMRCDREHDPKPIRRVGAKLETSTRARD